MTKETLKAMTATELDMNRLKQAVKELTLENRDFDKKVIKLSTELGQLRERTKDYSYWALPV